MSHVGFVSYCCVMHKCCLHKTLLSFTKSHFHTNSLLFPFELPPFTNPLFLWWAVFLEAAVPALEPAEQQHTLTAHLGKRHDAVILTHSANAEVDTVVPGSCIVVTRATWCPEIQGSVQWGETRLHVFSPQRLYRQMKVNHLGTRVGALTQTSLKSGSICFPLRFWFLVSVSVCSLRWRFLSIKIHLSFTVSETYVLSCRVSSWWEKRVYPSYKWQHTLISLKTDYLFFLLWSFTSSFTPFHPLLFFFFFFLTHFFFFPLWGI